jgi:hypothetical protein
VRRIPPRLQGTGGARNARHGEIDEHALGAGELEEIVMELIWP